MQQILAKEADEGSIRAMIQLLLFLPYKNDKWPEIFLKVLRAADYGDVRTLLVSAACQQGKLIHYSKSNDATHSYNIKWPH